MRPACAGPLQAPGETVKILVVDDHPLVLQAVAQLLAQVDPQMSVLVAEDRDDALCALAAHPDCALVLLDLALPGSRGLAFFAELRRDRPRLPIVVLSATHDRGTVAAAREAGARGYIAKTADSDEFLAAVVRVLSGGTHFTTHYAGRPPADDELPDAGALGLTRRQAQVLRLLVQGKPNKLICRDLRLSEGTVKVHVSAILRALNVHSRSQAIVALGQRGFGAEAMAVQR